MKEQAKKRLKDWSAYSQEMTRISGHLEASLDDELAAKIMQPGKSAADMWNYILAKMQKKLLPKTPASGAYGFSVDQGDVFQAAVEYLNAPDEEVKKVTDALKATGVAKGGSGTKTPAKPNKGAQAKPPANKPNPKPQQPAAPGGQPASTSEGPAASGQLTLMDMLGG